MAFMPVYGTTLKNTLAVKNKKNAMSRRAPWTGAFSQAPWPLSILTGFVTAICCVCDTGGGGHRRGEERGRHH